MSNFGGEYVAEWVHLQYPQAAQFAEVYGFSGAQGLVNLEGVRFRPPQSRSKTLVIMMHPSSSLQYMPIPRALAAAGLDVLCAGSRYYRNDTPLIMEKVAIDLAAYFRHAREVWKYDKVVLLGWSGGGSLSLFYQSQAERPTITRTPAGDPVDLTEAGLVPADAVIFQAATASRAALLLGCIDPSVIDEERPDLRDRELDIYDPGNPNQPPYSPDFIAHYRAQQLARMRRRTAWVRERLDWIASHGGRPVEQGFVTHRTMADLRFVDPNVDPNDRRPGWCYMGEPGIANEAPSGLGRFSTLRAWLSQWSIDDTNAHGPTVAAAVEAPLLVINNTADDAAPASDAGSIYAAAASPDKTFHEIKGATHFYLGQPELMREAIGTVKNWIDARNLLS